MPLRVNDAIARGVQRLFETQLSDGRWVGDETRFPGGLTAFTCYTLVKSGVRRNDPRLRLALDALAGIPAESTYGRSARLLLYETQGERERWLPAARTCLDDLLATQREGLWGYPGDPIDLSNVQFALLGLRAAEGLGLEVPDDALIDCARALFRFHDAKQGGAFFYRPGVPVTGGITAATLGDLALLDVFAEERPALGRALNKDRKKRAAADEWLVEHWDPARNAWGQAAWTPSWHHAYLWAVERYCELEARALLGGHDWYREGAEHLVASQGSDGSWGTKVEDTCFALLFLRRTTFSGAPELAGLDEPRAAVERARPPRLSADAPYVTDWLVAGPFAGERDATGLADPPFAPERVRVKDGSRVGKERWRRRDLKPSSWTDLEELTGREADHCVWALATRMRVESEFEGLLWFTFEDGWRVWIDGEEVSSGVRVQAPIVPSVRVPLELERGDHVVVVLLEDVLGDAAFAARLSDPAGAAAPNAPAVGLD